MDRPEILAVDGRGIASGDKLKCVGRSGHVRDGDDGLVQHRDLR